jgi:hypothetical protein
MTAQAADRIEVNGEPWDLTTPLEIGPFRELIGWTPLQSSACWRGYIADWVISDGLLLLRSWSEGRGSDWFDDDAWLWETGDRRIQGGPVLAEWVSGDAVIGRGDRLTRPSFGRPSRRPEEAVVTIERGHVVAMRNVPPYDGPIDVLSLGLHRFPEPER